MNSLSIEIRPVTPPDVPAISTLARKIWQATYPRSEEPRLNSSHEFVSRMPSSA